MLSERGVLGVVDKGVLESTNGFFLLVSFSSGLLDRFKDYLRRVNAEQGVSQKDFLVRSVVSVRLFDFFVTKRGDCFFFLVFVEPVFLLPGWLSFFRFNFFSTTSSKFSHNKPHFQNRLAAFLRMYLGRVVQRKNCEVESTISSNFPYGN